MHLWPKVRELAQAPDLMDRVVQQVQAMGVVNERELIVLILHRRARAACSIIR